MEKVPLEIVTLIITAIIGIPSYVFIYDRWVTPWRKRINERNTPKFGKEYFKCLWCKKYVKHEIVESEQKTKFLYTTCTKCSKKLIWHNHEPPQIVEPLKLHRRCFISCKKVSLHELEDVVTKEISVDQKTGELFYSDITEVSYVSIEDLNSLFLNKPNDSDVKDVKVYKSETMECYVRRCINKKCKELHYWTENNRIIWERKTKRIKLKTTS